MKRPHVLLIALAGITAALALSHFIAIKPIEISWGRWIEHGFNRYQTFLAGLGAVVVAWLSVMKISEQIALQREQAVSNKRFVLRSEMAALEQCFDFIEIVMFEIDEVAGELTARSGLTSLQSTAEDIIRDHGPGLPLYVRSSLAAVIESLKSYNWQLPMTEETEGGSIARRLVSSAVAGPYVSRKKLLEKINEDFRHFQALSKDAMDELDKFLK